MKTDKREHEEPGSVLLRGIFKLGKISHDVLLTSTSVSWTPITPDNPTGYRLVTMAAISPDNPTGEQGSERGSHRVWLRDVFAVKVKRRRAAGQQTGGAVLGLCLFCSHRTGNTLQEVRTHLLNTSLSLCHTWVTQLTQLLTVLPRPKQLKVFINPGSHKKQSVLIYREHIAPLFRMADIHTDITSSTDIISCSVHGVRHPITAALHIILGHLQQVDMCSFSSLGRLLTFGFSAMFGFGGRSLALAERNRWMPPSQRRDYALAKTVASLRPEECHLSFLPVNQKHKSGKRRSKEQDAATGLSWETKPGVYLSISIMSIPGLSPHAPRGLAPNTRLTNGSAELITVGNASRSEFIRHLKRYSCPDEQSSLSFVETRSVTAVKLRPYGLVGCPGKGEKEEATSGDDSEGSFPWNIDGELVEMAHEVVVRVHSRLISLYGEDVEKVDSPVMSCSCI
ncbi:ceramide kinase-like protein isoform X9 [Gadus morhua]|uniref:ceramide kinase-like protein isoform X9 n=1 Tax=Gadus morhua TaxID=8049 RepID=UPI0011B5FF23|nr:ceramide kinase-like protein isoform X9 [Gadus morhua]